MSNDWAYTVQPPPPKFIRGDANMNEFIEVSDGLKVLSFLYHEAPVDCEDALDANDNGDVEMLDAFIILNYLFMNGPEPAPPFSDPMDPTRAKPGSDPTREDNAGCAVGIPQS